SPGVGDDHSRQHDDEQRQHAPKPDRVVPIEIARLARQPALEPEDVSHRSPFPLARPPQIKAAHDNEEEPEIARAGDSARRGAAFALRAEPAMPVSDAAKEVSNFL